MPTPQNSSGLRSRKVDFKKPLLVFRLRDIPLQDQASVLERNIPTFATGVEKEEEEEHHLQAALIASQNALANVVIPTPDASKVFSEYQLFYDSSFILPKSLIRCSAQLEESMGCLYNLDETDDQFLSTLRDKDVALNDDEFEQVMWVLESFGNERTDAPSQQECWHRIEEQKLDIMQHVFAMVYDHWFTRRYQELGGKSIQPLLKSEEMSTKPDSDPYVCFRKRDLKPLRKVRRSDGQALEKLKRLRDELIKAREILELVVSREATRKEALAIDISLFEQRNLVRKLKKKLGLPCVEKDWDVTPLVRPTKKIRKEQREGTKIRIPMHKIRDAANMVDMDASMDGTFTLSLEEQAKKKKLTDEKDGWLDLTEDPFIGQAPVHPGWMKRVSLLPDSKLCCALRRVGRGGRIMIDRHISRRYIQFTNEEKKALEAFRFDDSSDELDSEPEWVDDEDINFIKYRTFTACPKEEEYRHYMNKPSHLEQVSIQPVPLGYRPTSGAPPPQVIRAPLPQAKKKKEVKTPQMTPNTIKKKAQESVDARSAAVKAMMQQAQRQAHQTQLQIQQLQQSPTESFMSSPPDTLKQTDAKPHVNSAAPTPMKNPSLQQQHARLQQMRLQQLQSQQALQYQMSQAAILSQNTHNLTPQQIQQLYFNHSAQNNSSDASSALNRTNATPKLNEEAS